MNVANSQNEKGRWKKWSDLSTFRVSFLSYGP